MQVEVVELSLRLMVEIEAVHQWPPGVEEAFGLLGWPLCAAGRAPASAPAAAR